MELWDVYDQYRHKTGRTHERGKPLMDGDFHLVVHIWIVNDEGQFLIQKRQPWKIGYPNMWDCSAAGSAIVGDSSKQAALRESKEELGIDLDMSQGDIVLSYKRSHGFDDIWFIKQNIDINELKLQYEEVEDAKWVNRWEIMNLIAEGKFIAHHYIENLFEIINSHLLLHRTTVEDLDNMFVVKEAIFKSSHFLQKRKQFVQNFPTGDCYKIIYNNKLFGIGFVYEKDKGKIEFYIIYSETYQNGGLAQEVIQRLENLYVQANQLILSIVTCDECNHHVNQKLGYKLIDESHEINSKLILARYIKNLEK